VLLAAAGWGVMYVRSMLGERQAPATIEIVEEDVTRGAIRSEIVTAGAVEPQNRLEVKPPIGGRVEELRVSEGDKVAKGDVLALLSSTERAALLDAAAAKGGGETDYWKNVYKATPLISPIDGEVIVRNVEPGQTVGAGTPVVVLSDRLIVKARVDETDIGGVAAGQKAGITLDAYPDVRAKGTVDHISYESKTVNNVVVYEVDIVLAEVPEVFRSGMSAEVTIVTVAKDNALLVPADAVTTEGGRTFVNVREGQGEAQRDVVLGISNTHNVEVTGGLQEGDVVLLRRTVYVPPAEKKSVRNPFTPFGRGKKDEKKKR